MKRIITMLITIIFVLSSIIGPLLENTLNLKVYASDDMSVFIVDYVYGPLELLDPDPSAGAEVDEGQVKIGNKTYSVANESYSNIFNQSNYDLLFSKKNVVGVLHNNKMFKIYDADDLTDIQITAKTNPQRITYEDGHFNVSKFSIDIEISNEINGDCNFPDEIYQKIYSTVSEIKLSSQQDGLNFGKTGFAWFTNYTTEVSNNYTDKIHAGESKKYSFEVNTNDNYKMYSSNGLFNIDCVVKFDNNREYKKTAQMQIGNLDYRDEVIENKKTTSSSRKAVTNARSSLETKANSAVTYTSTLDQYLTKSQSKYVKNLLYVWVADIFAATSSDYAKRDTSVQEKIIEKLGIDKNILTTVTSTQATLKMELNTTIGKRTIQFDLKLNNYILGKVSYSGFGTFEYSMYKSSLQDNSENITGKGMVALADMEAFVNQLKVIANDAIEMGYNSFWGNNANKVADYLTSGTIIEVLKNNGIIKDSFSGDLYKLLKEPTERYIKSEIHCPVDVNVYDEDGILVGSIKNNTIVKNTGELYMYVSGDEKYIEMLDGNYRIELVGNDNGSMNYVVDECDEAGNVLRAISYNNINLSNGLIYNAFVPNAGGLPENMYNLYDKDNNEISNSQINEIDENSFLSIGNKFTIDALTYQVIANGEIEVQNCDKSIVSINIPKYVSYKGYNYKVTRIGDSSFKDCSKLTYVSIPKSVKKICAHAFNDTLILKNQTSNIKYVDKWAVDCDDKTISASLKSDILGIADNAFDNCLELENIIIPDSVIIIGDYAFSNCSNLTDIKMPNNLTFIGEYAFQNCKNLASITIPGNVTNIGYRAFLDCNVKSVYIFNISNWCNFDETPLGYGKSVDLYLNGQKLENLIIPNGITKIKEYAFHGCTSITSITFPENEISIDQCAFGNCKNLTSVNITNSILNIEDGVFYNCQNIKSVYISDLAKWCNINFKTLLSNPLYYGADLYLNGKKTNNLFIPSDVNKIGNYTFCGCSSLTSIIIPDSVTSIGEYAFCNCSSLTSITIPNSVTSIGDSAFSGCSSLTTITIPDSVTSIGDGTFGNCSSLESITIPNSVTSIGSDFNGCSSLTTITIPDSVTSIEGYAFEGCSSLTNITIPDSVTSIGSSAFEDCTSLTSVTIPNSVTSIGYYAFYNCENLTSITIPDGVISIEWSTFRGCSSLTSVTIPNSVTSIGDSAFSGCSSLTTITIPDSVTSIGDGTFGNCSSLESITIPNSVTSIGSAFSGCSSLTTITIPDSVTSIGDSTFGNCSSLESITIPNSITSIGGSAFEGCSNLTSITIPDSVTSIGDYAFKYCFNIMDINVYKSNKSYSSTNGVLFNKNATELIQYPTGQPLESYVIPNGVTKIRSWAFNNCLLKSIVIPNSVKSIEEKNFELCWFLTDVYYTGSKDDWDKINIGSDNYYLKNATIHYNYNPNHIHTFNEWIVTKQATCTTTGKKQRKCSCGNIETKTINVLGHKFVKSKVVKPTVNSQGYTLYKCLLCGATEKKDFVAKLKKTSSTSKPIEKKISISKAKITGIKDITYTGKQIKPKLTVKVGKTTLKNGIDYTLKFGKNKSVGKGTVTIIGKGKYAGKITKTFKILPAKTSAKLSSTKGKIKVTLKKVKGAKKYQIQYATNKKFKSAKKITTTLIKKSFKAKSKKTYYVRVRSVNGKYVSGWSAVKKIKVK